MSRNQELFKAFPDLFWVWFKHAGILVMLRLSCQKLPWDVF